jgi:hypothetical protein
MAEYEVADPFAAFATAFLNQSAEYIKNRKDDANEAKERMYELAQRNKGKVDQYMLAVNNVGNVAEKLHKNYNIPQAAIVALNRTGPTALTDAYTQLEKMAATHSREFVSKYADMIIEGYNPDEYDTGTPFRQQIESQFTEGLSVGDYEADERSWWDKAIGRGAKDSMREALDREIIGSGISVYDMANFSEASAYRRVSGDTTFRMPRIMSGEDRIEIEDNFLSSVRTIKLTTPQLDALEESIEEEKANMQMALRTGKVSAADVETLKTTDPDEYNSYMQAKARYEDALKERSSILKPQVDQRLRSIASQYDNSYEAIISMESTFDNQMYPGYTREFLAENNIKPLSANVLREPPITEDDSVPSGETAVIDGGEPSSEELTDDSVPSNVETPSLEETSAVVPKEEDGPKDRGILEENYSSLPPHESIFKSDFEINGKTLEVIKLSDGNIVVVNKTDSVIHTPEYSEQLLKMSNIESAMRNRYGPDYSKLLKKNFDELYLAKGYADKGSMFGGIEGRPLTTDEMLAEAQYQRDREVKQEVKEEEGEPLVDRIRSEVQSAYSTTPWEGLFSSDKEKEEALPPVEEPQEVPPSEQEADEITNYLMDNFGMDIVMHVMRQGATTDEQIYDAIKEWGRENEKITPIDMSGIIYGVKVGMDIVRRQANE